MPALFTHPHKANFLADNKFEFHNPIGFINPDHIGANVTCFAFNQASNFIGIIRLGLNYKW